MQYSKDQNKIWNRIRWKITLKNKVSYYKGNLNHNLLIGDAILIKLIIILH